MFGRKGMAAIAVSSLLACASMVRAADLAPASDTSVSNQPVLLQDAAEPAAPAAAPSAPMMAGLEKVGIGKNLEAMGIKLTGFVEGSWTFDMSHPNAGNGGGAQSGGFIAGRAFDVENESVILDQVDLALVKTVDTTKKFDIGFNLENVYGADAAFIHSNGLTIYSPTKIGLARHPKDQYDLVQANISVLLPVGSGLTLTAGKFVTFLGQEVINPTGNMFYSHSFLFTQIPFTQTGVYASYAFSDALSATVGTSRGWDQALDDVNGSLDIFGEVAYTSGNWKFILNASSGDQEPTGSGLDGWRTVLDGIISYQYSDNLKLVANLDYGWEPQADAGGTAQWYGAAIYAGFKVCDQLTLNARGEWFNTPDGFSPAALSIFGAVPNTFYEVTLGAAITPFPTNNWASGLVIRPEVRCDYASVGAWSGDNTHDQLTAAVEAYYAF